MTEIAKTDELPIYAELQNCLTSYEETVRRIGQVYQDYCEKISTAHDMPIQLCIHDLLSIDADMKANLKKIEPWLERQKKIASLEQRLEQLSEQINSFAQGLSESQKTLQSFLDEARNIQMRATRADLPKMGSIMQSARGISRASPFYISHPIGATPWMPSPAVIANAGFTETKLSTDGTNVPIIAAPEKPLDTKRKARGIADDDFDDD